MQVCAAELWASNRTCGEPAGREVAVICPVEHVRTGAICGTHMTMIAAGQAYCYPCRRLSGTDARHIPVQQAEPAGTTTGPIIHAHG